MKQSQNRWYVVTMVEGILKCFELGRFVSFNVLDEEFSRDESVQAENLFRDCFGIWDDPKMSVEDIRLRFSPLDGRFIKTLPSQASSVRLHSEARRTVWAQGWEEGRHRPFL